MTKQEKQREASKRWYEKHKEEIKAKRNGTRHEEHKAYYEKNREKIDAKNLAWALEHKDRMREMQRKSRSSNHPRRLWNHAKSRALKKGIEFTITVNDIIIPTSCPYLGTPFVYGTNEATHSLDRIDNTKGYIPGNIEVISYQANRMKNTATKEELILFAKNILLMYQDLG